MQHKFFLPLMIQDIEPIPACSYCGEWKPNINGLCINKGQNKHDYFLPNYKVGRKDENNLPYLVCRHCGEWKPNFSQFCLPSAKQHNYFCPSLELTDNDGNLKLLCQSCGVFNNTGSQSCTGSDLVDQSAGDSLYQYLITFDSNNFSENLSPKNLEAGMTVSMENSELVTIPIWLKGKLPMCISPKHTKSLVDLSLPLHSNPFYVAMIEHMGSSRMMTTLEDSTTLNKRDHILLLGSSGCGKTSACFSLAAKHFVIYLECVSPSNVARTSYGYRMAKELWYNSLAPLQKSSEVEQAFYTEVAVRLVILINMLKQYTNSFTPLHWLTFILSDEGNDRVCRVHDELIKSNLCVTRLDAQDLMDIVTKLCGGSVPVLLVDELQQLSSRKVSNADGPMSLMKAVVQAAALLTCPVVWSGTRMGVTAASSQHSGIAKHLDSQNLLVVGDFEYLTAEQVMAYLNTILNFSETCTNGMKNQLSYLLQGRARMVTGFIAALLTPNSSAMKRNAYLDDAVLSEALENFMENLVVKRFKSEINRFHNLGGGKGMSVEDLGYVWCSSMLNNFESTEAMVRDTANRNNSLAFTSHVHEVLQEDKKSEEKDEENSSSIEFNNNVEYEFDYIFGEPGLQEALLRIVWSNSKVADAGIRSVLRGALNGAAIGSYLDFAVALALISRRESILKDLCENHPTFGAYTEYQLQISRVVFTSKAQDQLEWFQKVIEDPEDDTFSLLPGVPVKYIAILPSVHSGADLICVAVEGPPVESTVHPMTPVKSTLHQEPSASPPAPFPYMTRKRKMEEKSAATEAHKPPIVFVQVCCASYKGGVTSTKHNDQESKSTNQFSAVENRCAAGVRYKEVAREKAGQFKYLPILVEISQLNPQPKDNYILITDKNAEILFSPSVVAVLKR